MKKTIKTMTAVIAGAALTLGLSLTSCKKGDTGPAGPAGTNGTNGAANIQNYQVTINPNDWTWDNVYKQWYFRYDVNASSQSAISAYIISGNGAEVMPYYHQTNFTTTSFSSYLFSSPTPYILFKFYNGSATLAKPTISESIRLVIIPPSMIKPNVNIDNYADVKAAYSLKD
jgi:hypothetical protein